MSGANTVRDPLLIEVPEAFETPRLRARLLRKGEGEMLYHAIVESLAELKPWMPWAQSPSPDASEAFVRRAIASFHARTELSYGVFTRSDERFIGCVGAHDLRWSVPRFEVGYWCRTSEVGRGYVTEVVRALVSAMFHELGAARVELRTDDRNTRSAAVAERLGFPLEGVLRQDARGVDGALRDTRLYARTSAEGL